MDDNTRKVMHSSAKQDWGTPQWLYDKLDAVFNFTTDVCASAENAKHAHYFDESDDALSLEWDLFHDSNCWMNSPYGRTLGKWVTKAVQHKTVALLPARTGSGWFQTVWEHAEVICFMDKRIKFEGAENSAPFDSVIAVFGQVVTPRQMRVLEELGRVVRWKS